MTREEAIKRLEDTFEAWDGWVKKCPEDAPARLLNEALGMAITALRNEPRWISVEERLPEGWWIDPDTGYGEPEEYLVFVKGAMAPTVANYIDGKFVNLQQNATGFADVITHWMPLPEPPEVPHE